MADAVSNRALYVYCHVEVERADSPSNRTLFVLTEVAGNPTFSNVRTLYAYTTVAIETITPGDRALYAYTDIVFRTDPETPVEFHLLDSNWDVEHILKAK